MFENGVSSNINYECIDWVFGFKQRDRNFGDGDR